MRKVLVVFPSAWDKKQLESCRDGWENEFEVLFADPTDWDCPWDFDVVSFIERTAEEYRGRIDGVTSTSDYPGQFAAAAIAERLGLPGPRPEDVIRSAHKYYSRIAQQEAAPEATPRFDLIHPESPRLEVPKVGFPCFVKPVKGTFSVLARRMDTPDELRSFLAKPAVSDFRRTTMRMFNQLLRRYTDWGVDGGYFVAEELLQGHQVTVEGFCYGGEVGILGVVDSVFHPGTNSFLRFDYPSRLGRDIQARMADIAKRVVARLQLDPSFFNLEMMYDASNDRISIVEVNPRLCRQFGDLYAKVDGTNTYEMALRLVTGERPQVLKGQGSYRVAASFPLRVFSPVRVIQAPDEATIREAESLIPGTLIWTECQAGQELSDFESVEDGQSCRYGIINAGATSFDRLLEVSEHIRSRLGYEFQPLKGGA